MRKVSITVETIDKAKLQDLFPMYEVRESESFDIMIIDATFTNASIPDRIINALYKNNFVPLGIFTETF